MAFTLLLALFCAALIWLAHSLGSWRAALLLYPLPALAAWHLGAPWMSAVMAASAIGLFVRDWRAACRNSRLPFS